MRSRCARLRIDSASRVATTVHKMLRSGVRRVCCTHQDPAYQDTILGVSDTICSVGSCEIGTAGVVLLHGASEETNGARAWNNLRLCGRVLLPRCA